MLDTLFLTPAGQEVTVSCHGNDLQGWTCDVCVYGKGCVDADDSGAVVFDDVAGGEAIASSNGAETQSLDVLTLDQHQGVTAHGAQHEHATNSSRRRTVRATPAHLALASHAIILAVVQGVSKGDMTDVARDAVKNAKSVSPVSAFVLRKFLDVPCRK